MEVFKKFILVMSLAVSLFATQVAAMEGNPLAAYEHKGSTVGEYTFDGRRWRSPRKFVSRDLVYRAMQASTSSAVASAAVEVEVDASSRTGAGDISWPAVGSFAFGSRCVFKDLTPFTPLAIARALSFSRSVSC